MPFPFFMALAFFLYMRKEESKLHESSPGNTHNAIIIEILSLTGHNQNWGFVRRVILKPVYGCDALKKKQHPWVLDNLKIKQSNLPPILRFRVIFRYTEYGTRGQIMNWTGHMKAALTIKEIYYTFFFFSSLFYFYSSQDLSHTSLDKNELSRVWMCNDTFDAVSFKILVSNIFPIYPFIPLLKGHRYQT